MQVACLLLNIEFIPTPSLTQLYTIQRSNVYHKDMYDTLPIHRSSFPRCGVQHTAHWRIQSASHRRWRSHWGFAINITRRPKHDRRTSVERTRPPKSHPICVCSSGFSRGGYKHTCVRTLAHAGRRLRNTTHNLRNVSLIRKDPPPAFALNTVHNYAHCVCVYGRRTGRRIEQQIVRTAHFFPRKLLTQTPVDS